VGNQHLIVLLSSIAPGDAVLPADVHRHNMDIRAITIVNPATKQNEKSNPKTKAEQAHDFEPQRG